jgi:predicted TIM-barrel fold metal-dependent hydrolase
MQHFAVSDRRYYPLFELINELKAAVMIDVGTTGMGAWNAGRTRRADQPRPSEPHRPARRRTSRR